MIRTRQRSEAGASAVEFALVFPLLMLVLAGIVDFGRAFFTQVQLSGAAREGARAAVVLPVPAATDGIKTRATQAAPGVTPIAFPIVLQCPANGSGNATVEVSVTFDYIILGPMMRAFGGAEPDNSLSSKAVMKC